MQVKCKCGNVFRSRQAPCPDGIKGCLVAHYDEKSFVCPRCGYDSGPHIGKALREGHLNTEIGMGFANLGAIRKLTLG
jgi:hypothetical protein